MSFVTTRLNWLKWSHIAVICTSLIEIRASLQLFSYEWTCLTSKYQNLYLRPLIEVCTCRYASHIIVALHFERLGSETKKFLLNHD